uniref:C-type lectin domain-containing protein n=1 Tax=Acrobeloides nanus TaxID=290746 RepID=A0A914E3B0_9BILA
MQQDCLNMNSTLVTVHNDVENAIVQGLAVAYDAPALLGLHDSYNNGSYVCMRVKRYEYWQNRYNNNGCVRKCGYRNGRHYCNNCYHRQNNNG